MNPDNIRDAFMDVYTGICNGRDITSRFNGVPNRTIRNLKNDCLILKEIMRMGGESIIELNL